MNNPNMTLRQYYAAHAPELPNWYDSSKEELISAEVRWRFEYADAMITFEDSGGSVLNKDFYQALQGKLIKAVIQ